MSIKSRIRMAEHRAKLQELAIEDGRAAENRDEKTGRPILYTPASQRDIPAYPSKNKPKPKYAKDRFGVTDVYSTNRKEKRRGLRTN